MFYHVQRRHGEEGEQYGAAEAGEIHEEAVGVDSARFGGRDSAGVEKQAPKGAEAFGGSR